MKLFKEINALKAFLQEKRAEKRQIGFVPTMGALHNGHLSLIKASSEENSLTVCSIFVNPTQFNNADDLAKYPRTIENDMKLLIGNGCDVLFYPEVEEMYSGNEQVQIEDFGIITQTLEGHFRPGHFDGVITIVKKLFDAVEPDRAYFGQKDYQQCAVVAQLIKRNGLPVKLVICPTLREADGLAMSSRNVRLNAEERKIAKQIPEALFYAKEQIRTQSLSQLKTSLLDRLASTPLIKVDYFEIADAETLQPLIAVKDGIKAIALIAAWCGNVRLIDNFLLTD